MTVMASPFARIRARQPAHRQAPAHRRRLAVLRNDALYAQHGRCYWCLSPLLRREATAEHLVPESQGGATSRENVRAACRDCNEVKGSMSPYVFAAAILAPGADHGARIWRIHFRRLLNLADMRLDRAVLRLAARLAGAP